MCRGSAQQPTSFCLCFYHSQLVRWDIIEIDIFTHFYAPSFWHTPKQSLYCSIH